VEVETFRTVHQDRREKLDQLSVERGVRQLLADKVSGNLVGLWLLVPEHWEAVKKSRCSGGL
jgi:hypothetical protein